MRRRAALGAILLAAFGVRALYALWLAGEPHGHAGFDATWLDRVAREIAAGHGMLDADGRPSAFFAPGYPGLLALAYALFGDHVAVARTLQCALATLTCWLTWRIGALAYGPRVGLVAAGLLAMFPGDVFYTSLTLGDPAFGCALAACTWLFLRWSGSEDWRRWLGWGAALGVAALFRSVAALYLTVPLTVWAASPASRRGAARHVALAALGLSLVATPWILRNALVMGFPLPIASEGAFALFVAHSPVADGGWSTQAATFREREHRHLGPLEGPEAEVARAKADVAYAARFAATRPLRELQLVPRRVAKLFQDDHWALLHWTRSETDPRSGRRTMRLISDREYRWGRRIADPYFFAVLALAVLGATRVWGRGAPAAAVVPLTPLFFVAVHALLLYGSPRFHAPMLPTLCVLAAATLAGPWRPWRLAARR